MGDYAKSMGMKARRMRKNAKQEILKDDARGFRKRVAKAKRITGETVVPKPTKAARRKPKPSGERGFAKNPGDLGKLIENQQRKKPY
jgi:hypothetical protein